MEKNWREILGKAGDKYRTAIRQKKKDLYLKEWEALTESALKNPGNYTLKEIKNWDLQLTPKNIENLEELTKRLDSIASVEFKKLTDYDEKLKIYDAASYQWKENPDHFKSMILSIKELWKPLSLSELINQSNWQKFFGLIERTFGEDSFHYQCLSLILGDLLQEYLNSEIEIPSDCIVTLYKWIEPTNSTVSELQKIIIKRFLSS